MKYELETMESMETIFFYIQNALPGRTSLPALLLSLIINGLHGLHALQTEISMIGV
jgi:hypothetical protein